MYKKQSQHSHIKHHLRLILMAAFICCISLAPGLQSQAQVTPAKGNLGNIIRSLEKKWTDYKFLYDFEALQTRQVDKEPDIASLSNEQVLALLNKAGFITYRIEGNSISIAILPASRKQTIPGKITGKIIDEENGQAVAGATVRIGNTGMVTDESGSYYLSLPQGNYTASISYVGYGSKEVNEIQVENNKVFELNITLKREKGQLETVVVKSSARKEGIAALYATQKASIAMTDGISSAQIGRTADNNVAQALRRMPGVTISEGKFVTIRGLSERYNNVKLNGAEMPSTEPNRKNFSFDVIPTALVDNIVVAKTFIPEMSAEFAGGSISVNTLSIPNQKFLTLSLGTGFNTNSTGKDFWGGKRFGSDYQLGNAKERSWFGRDWNPQWYSQITAGDMANTPSKDFKNLGAANAMNAKVPNHWNLYRYTGAPTQSYSISTGLPFAIKKNHFGIVAGVNYRHEETTEDYGSDNDLDPENEQYNNDENFTKLYASKRFNFITGTGVLANIGWQNGGNKISWKNMYNNRFVNASYYQMARKENESKQVTFFNDPRRTQVLQTRLEGSHKVLHDRLNVSWYADYNDLSRVQMDERNIRGTIINGQDDKGYNPLVQWGYLGTTDGGYSHIFRGRLNEKKKNYGADVEVPFKVLGNLQKIKAGYQSSFRDAHYTQSILNVGFSKLEDGGSNSLEDFLSPEKFLDSTYYYTGFMSVQLPGVVEDYYNGSLDIRSAFIQGDFSFFEKLHVSGGVRREDSHFFTDGVQRDIGNSRFIDSTRTDFEVNWYPSASVIYNLTSKINLRSSYSKTISRFDFRELSSTTYFDIAQNMKTYGTDSLRNTYIRNYDARLEWYPSPDEIISITGFVKKFTDPIELNVSMRASRLVAQPMNLKSATGKGLELNVRKSLGFIHAGTSWLKNIYVSGNAMYMKMNVEYQQEKAYGKDSVRNRPLQDLVPYSINGALSWEGTRFGASANYGTTGRKLTRASITEFEDEYLAPRHLVDLQVSARFLKNRLQIKANVSDLLAQPVIIYRNMGYKHAIKGWLNDEQDYFKPYTDDMNYNKGKDWVNRKYKRGSTYSMSINYNF